MVVGWVEWLGLLGLVRDYGERERERERERGDFGSKEERGKKKEGKKKW